ncbi:hypothetical protein SCUP234_11587 [Seiridium cupressi]
MPLTRSWKTRALLALMQSCSAVADNDLAAVEEAAVLPDGFSPRMFDGSFPVQPFVKRQDSGTCANGGHSCAEIGEAAANKCCNSDKYCYYKSDWGVGCCGFGTTCDPSCTGTYYRVNVTTPYTTSVTVPTSGTESAATPTVLISSGTTTFVGCSPRGCPVSSYQCPSSMGGRCCANTEICASNTQCIKAVSTTPTLVPTRGCSGTPSATDCPNDGGCCLKGETCVSIDGTLGCTGTADAPPGSNVTTTGESLSQGAKAGIGAGVAVGAAIVIGLLTWFCIRRRREARTAGDRTRSRGPTPGLEGTIVGGGEMSDISRPSRSRRVHHTGLVYQYLGPNAVHGPYTQQEDVHDSTPGARDRGVPSKPQGPGDILAPVEIGSSLTEPKDGTEVVRGPSTRSAESRGLAQEAQDTPVYELEALSYPSPLSPDDASSPQSPTPGSPGPISPPGGTMRTDYLR